MLTGKADQMGQSQSINKLSIILLVLVIFSAFAVITVRHENRLAFAHLHGLDHNLSQLKTEWGRLLIEKATWNTGHNIADSVGSRLGMHPPAPEKIVTVYLKNARLAISTQKASSQ